MGLGSAVGLALAVGCGKFLFKRFVGKAAKPLDEPPTTGSGAEGIHEGLGGAVGEGLAAGLGEIIKERIKDAADRRKAEREFEDLGDRIVERLRKDLASQYAGVPEERWDKVLGWVNLALGGNITANFVVHHGVDSAKLFEALRAVPLNVPGPATAEEEQLRDTALREVARHLAAAASKLPRFEEENARTSLDLLTALRVDFDDVLDDVRFIREQ
ncbi:MAG TPA: hypothetical protein VGE74_01640, partial [Gemmata sp.]